MTEKGKLWGGRFTGEPDAAFARFNRSFGFDRRLFGADIEASLAHARGLLAANVLDETVWRQIDEALKEIRKQHKLRGESYFNEVPDAEDVHSFIEARLIELIGDAGKRLHTGRSRNDQVATAMRLWTRDAIDELSAEVKRTQESLVSCAEQNFDAVLPGYTHLQRAQPVLWAHWCLAYVEMLARDVDRLNDARRRTNSSPLGSAALAGTSYDIDREAVARELGFENVTRNSLDAVSDRDFLLDFTHAASVLMMHLSRIAEDIILYATNEFGFIELSDKVATGSSLMPQKKNPDAMELVRGKAARVFGHHNALLVLLKGLPLAYNKDLQEDKEAVFDTFDTALASLQTTRLVIENITLRTERMKAAAQEGYMNATELADYLVRRGMPFRTAHDTTGQIVRRAIERGCEIDALTLDELKEFSDLIDADVYDHLSLEQTLDTKAQTGGTARVRVREELERRAQSEIKD